MGVSEQGLKAFLAAREFLLTHRDDYEAAYRDFRWPQLNEFNWALDYFDTYARDNRRPALWIVDDAGTEVKLSFAEISQRSNQVANFFREQGVCRGDRILVQLSNHFAMWEIMLAATKLGAVIVPAATLLTVNDLRDRLERGRARLIVTQLSLAEKFSSLTGDYIRVVVGGEEKGWLPYSRTYDESLTFTPTGKTHANDPLMLYFTSGTTALPKLVLHTHQSYPLGHLATMYWIGIRTDDIHFNISTPGWAKHAWSSFFAPWNAGATIFVHNYDRFKAARTLDLVARGGVTTMCAPPTVWRLFILENLSSFAVNLRELASAGEPLNPEVIERVRAAWNITVRDGFGQTENVLLLGNFPGQMVKPGAVGRPSPGHDILLLDADGNESDDGEITVRCDPRPPSLMSGYLNDPERTQTSFAGGYYRTGDVAHRDGEGYFTYVGRADDVFKSSDYRLSPFELESALIELDCVAEAAVVPSADPIRWHVPKAFITLKPGFQPTPETAREIFKFVRARLAPYKRIRRIEFSELPKTISGKIRRVQLRTMESTPRQERRLDEYWEEDFSDV
ncbi:MAG: AMP-binding protein [Acidobacteria bacterium]|nr:AMP-binding protein [Acidobacteriota bacterium]MBV9624019.1 AMP-binding protein [Acidobacteriota bacterium]